MKFIKFFGLLTFFVSGLFLGAALIIKADLDKPVGALDEGVSIAVENSKEVVYSSLEEAFISVSEKVNQAVVSIYSERTKSVGGEYYYNYPFGKNGGNEFFERFFNDFFGEIPKREFKSMGLGSGIIIDPRGYILTNEHVIHNADKITVTLPDGRELRAELIGKDYRSDLAVLKIPVEDSSYVKLGDSDNVRIGQWAIAIGNPFGYAVDSPEPTLTVGVISALHRSLPATEYRDRIYTDLIQTDAAINPGNSGGPLLNLNAEVVGINVAIYTTSGGYQGVGFAIPVNQAKYVLDKLLKGEEVEYGWLGVQIQDLNQELADYLGVPDIKGALIAKIMPDSPAEGANLKEGDVIRKLDGVSIENTKDLMSKVIRTNVGKEIICEIIRDKSVFDVKMKLGKRPFDAEIEVASDSDVMSDVYNWRGMTVSTITDDVIRAYKLETKEGVVVVKVSSGSVSSQASIREGDLIFEINKMKVVNLETFKSITANIKGQSFVRTQRGYILVAAEE